MKKIAGLNLEDDWPKPSDILKYYERVNEFLRWLERQARVGEAVTIDHPFYGMTPREVDQEAQNLRSELEKHVSLMLTASFEAVLRVDLATRIQKSLRDESSRKLREKFGRCVFRAIRLEALIDAWRQLRFGQAHVFGKFKQLILFRHWLAHGRYWRQTSGVMKVDPLVVWDRGTAVLDIVSPRPEVGYTCPDA